MIKFRLFLVVASVFASTSCKRSKITVEGQETPTVQSETNGAEAENQGELKDNQAPVKVIPGEEEDTIIEGPQSLPETVSFNDFNGNGTVIVQITPNKIP